MALKSLNFTSLEVGIDSEDLTVLSDKLKKKRMMAPDFFSDAPIVVKVENDQLNLDFSQLKKVVSEQDFILLGISGDLSQSQKDLVKSQKIAILRSSKRQHHQEEAKIESENQSVEAEKCAFANGYVKTKIHTGRVRSGQQIYAKEGDLVINGDVGAGAEVIADGNIHIYGALRGKALAGAMGEQEALIFCQSFTPELVSISGIYKLSDDLAADFVSKGCIVSLQDEQIVLSNLSQI